MKEVKVTIVGTSPLLMHSERLSNPLDPITNAKKPITAKRKKTEEDHVAIARLEFEGGMYHDEKIGPYIPGRNIKAALIRAATKTKEGPKVRSGLIVLEGKCRLDYSGPRDVQGLWDAEIFADVRSVVTQSSRTMRCRPVFHDWKVTFTVLIDETQLEESDVARLAETAGRIVGLCDYRPEKGGDYGRFEVAA